MNMHVPQSLEAEAELMVLCRCSGHIVTAQRNAPINSVVQDALIASLLITMTWADGSRTMVDSKIAKSIYKDAEISESRIQDLMLRGKKYYPSFINFSRGGDKDFVDGEIPGSLFISVLFPHNFCYTKNTETDPLKPEVLIEDGIVLPESGPFCVKSVGAKTGSVVHELWKNSQELALHFISDLQQITDRWLPTHGFSMGIHDCFASNESEVAKVLIETRMKVADIIQNGAQTGESKDRIEAEINTILNNAMAVGPKLAKEAMAKGEKNALNVMRNSGAKGSIINLAQIVAFVGQQNIKGKRMPMQLSHGTRSLYCFLPGDISPEARGFVENNYVRGLTPAQAYFHAAAGRDGVIATAIKSVTGDTPILIVRDISRIAPPWGCNCEFMITNIGNWIDMLLSIHLDKIEKYPNNMELLNISNYNICIPTTDEYGNVSWGLIKNITRHDPSPFLYKIKTIGEREVTVVDSKSLLIWNGAIFERVDASLVRVGDFMPVTMNLSGFSDLDIPESCKCTLFEKQLCTVQNDVILDKIISIDKIDVDEYRKKFPQYNGKVYDLTVPSTLNFGLANGLHVVDTADTGYMQKKIARKIEDLKMWIDGSVRDANGRIISFMYGDDGMDAKKLMSVKGLNVPFFVNPVSLARQLNSDAKRSKEVRECDNPRFMTDLEIKVLLNVLSFSGISSPVIDNVLANTKETLRKIMHKVQIYDCKISDLIVKICETYNHSKASYGLAVGLVSGSCLGEPATQMVLNVFHFAGCKGKDATTGVPRYKELINTTKTKDQKSPSCEVYFNHPQLTENSIVLSDISLKNSEEKITELKTSSLQILKNMRGTFEETYVGDFLEKYELKFLPINPVNSQDRKYDASPIGLVTYEEYSEEWWVTLSKDLNRIPKDAEPESWVIVLHFDVEKLYTARIDLEDICFAIESENRDFICIPSPNIIGRIEMYCTLCEMKDYVEGKMNFSTERVVGSTGNRENFVNENNIEYFICRDVIIDFVKNVKISGIEGVSKVYPREVTSNEGVKEYVLDTEGCNFLDILTAPHVDFTRTICDDMHSILATLGIEATRRFLFNDVKRVISFDGTYIDPRHISVLVDCMTVNGNLDAASRDGIQRDVGPNAKIMFEKNIDNAATACAFTEKDKMVSMASAVMFGKLGKIGTGAVTIRDKEKAPIYT